MRRSSGGEAVFIEFAEWPWGLGGKAGMEGESKDEREMGRVICRHVLIIQPVVREDSLSGDLRQCLCANPLSFALACFSFLHPSFLTACFSIKI